jgi:hypothetical protein
LDDKYILPDRVVKAYRYGNKLEVTNSVGNPRPVKKISETHYLDAAGNVQKYNLSDNRSANLTSLRRSMNNLSRLIEHNFSGKPNEIWVTLTYANNEQDLKRVYIDYKNFINDLRKFVPDKYGNLEYIYAVEPQERGAWHVHALIKSERMCYLFIPQKDIERIWKRGFVSVRKVQPKDNIAAYLNAYLTNLKKDSGNSKKIIKEGRLHLYPRRTKFYRKSNGIALPLEFKGKKERLWERLSIANAITAPTKSYRYKVKTDYGSTLNVFREFYNLKEWLDNASNEN